MNHEIFMKRALQLAEKGRGKTSPNPLVGCVIVSQGKIVGEGYHEKAGNPHAEIIALKEARTQAEGATLYTTLEPCSHTGKTPPCANAIIEAGIKEVIFAVKDANPLVDGETLLKKAGIHVTGGMLEKEARVQNEIFFKYIQAKTPFVILKVAQTEDGMIAPLNKERTDITSKESRTLVHKMRGEMDAVLIGSGTLKADNPQLTPRLTQGNDPWKIIVSTKGDIPFNSQLLTHLKKTILATTSLLPEHKKEVLEKKGIDVIVCNLKDDKVDLQDLMFHLGARNITSILMEAGQEINTSALQQGIVDKMMIFTAPSNLGEGILPFKTGTLIHLQKPKRTKIGTDSLLEGYI